MAKCVTSICFHFKWKQIGTGEHVSISGINDSRRCGVQQGDKRETGKRDETGMKQIWKSHGIKLTTKVRLMKASVWPVATYRCESWTIKKRDERRIEAFEMKCIRRILRVSWTQKKTNEWVLETAGMERGLLNIIKRRKL